MNILLHICCGPCALFPLRTLRAAGHNVTGFFYNHNIHPYQEYCQRLDSVKKMAALEDLPMIYQDEYNLDEFLKNTAVNPEQRCSYCYTSRLSATASAAVEHGFSDFSASLLYSRYQRHDEIARLGNQMAQEFELNFYYQDFRTGWQEGIRLSKELGLYRQQYCGCIYSERERYHPEQKPS